MKEFISRYKDHLLALLAVLVISIAYLPGVWSGKGLKQSDIVQFKGAASEALAYEKQGEKILWTNSQFGGMPTYQISGAISQNPMNQLRLPKKPLVWDKIFLLMFCSFIMFLSFKIKPWLSLIGSIAVAFTSNNMIIISAGHNTQALAIAYLPLIIAGLQFLLQRRWFLGFNLLAFGMALQILVNHVQITFYAGIITLIYMLVMLIIHYKKQDLKTYFIAAGLSIIAVAIAFGTSAMNLMLTQEYTEYTIRGKSDLGLDPQTKAPKVNAPSDGLDVDYAFQWSNGWADLGALVIPNYAGGGSSTDLGSNSAFEGMLQAEAIKNFPFAYWGALPFTEGPIYLGACILFLAIFGLIFLKSNLRWWLLAAILLSIAMSTGKNHFGFLNDFLFNHVPFYNKFRAPTMALVIAQVCTPLLAILGLNAFFKAGKDEAERKFNALKIAGISTLGLLFILTFMSGMFTNFGHQVEDASGVVVKDYDQEVYEDYKIEPSKLVEVRKDLIRADGLRSMVFILLVFGILYYYHKNKLKLNLSLALIGLLVLVDLWMVDKRYLSGEDLVSKSLAENSVMPGNVDQAIMQDKSYHRVLDLRGNPMSSATASYFHKSLGGYHAAKIRRYQELFDWHISGDLQKGNLQNSPYLNMLNMKYAIYQNQQEKRETYLMNPNALGNAWLVYDYKIVSNADSALIAMTEFDPASEVVAEKKFEEQLKGKQFQTDSNSQIKLLTYHPEKLEYEYASSTEAIAVFSEIYYKKGWNAFIDGQPAEHIQVNYVLRAMIVPSGKHQIEFRFKPETYETSKQISYISSGLLGLILLASVGFWAIRRRNEMKAE